MSDYEEYETTDKKQPVKFHGATPHETHLSDRDLLLDIQSRLKAIEERLPKPRTKESRMTPAPHILEYGYGK